MKARAHGSANPDEWDFPPKPKRMRWSTYERLERKFDEAEDVLTEELGLLMARFLGRV